MKVQNAQPAVVAQLEQQAEGEASFVACRSWPRRSVLGNVVHDPAAAAAGRYRAIPRRRDRERSIGRARVWAVESSLEINQN